MTTQVKPMAIKLTASERERLGKLAEAKKRAAHWLAKEAIGQYLEREEAAERFRRETLERWEEFCQTGRSVPHDAVMEWLESWGDENEAEGPKCG